MVIVVANRIPVAKGWEAEFERRWRSRKWSVAELPGFIRAEVLRPIKGDTYSVVTHWEAMGDFERWTQSEAFQEAHADPPPKEAFSGPSVLEVHEVLASKEGGAGLTVGPAEVRPRPTRGPRPRKTRGPRSAGEQGRLRGTRHPARTR